MGAQKVIPSVVVHHCGGLAVPGHVYGFVAGETATRHRVQFHLADVSEVCSVCAEKPASGGIQHQAKVYGVAILVREGLSYAEGLGVLEIRRIGVQGLVPHNHNGVGVSASQSASEGVVSYQVPVAQLYGVRGGSAARAHATAVPGPAVLRAETAAACSKRIVLAVALDNCGWIVNEWLPRLGKRRIHCQQKG